MTYEQRILLRQTFEELVPLPKRFGLLFYQRLFELDPGLRPLFRGDIDRQASMLAEALALAVFLLVDEGKVSGHVQQLGARHHAYGVVDGHYETFGAALLWTFEQRLGAEFTPKVREAWLEAWEQLAAAMQTAARSAESAG
ncbi:MAG TPA: globin domain-containing protein [Thermoanaerobaculia bacterium]|nr:globin domain-containing protein [Thermoanaerobaculia bacterium]